MEISNEHKKNLYRAILAFLIVLSLFFMVKLLSEFKSYDMMGSSQANTITLSGHGEVTAVPDIANIYLTIRKEAKTVKEAQVLVVEVEKKVLNSLQANEVEDKDIKTENASFNPKYDSRQVYCITYPCSQRNPVIVGYEAYESIRVKIRNTDLVGKIMQELGALGVEELNGPNFTIDDEEALKMKARKKAIEDAKAKGKVLAKDLGVRLGRIASFSESGNYPGPMMYAKDAFMSAGTALESAPAELPKGENTISSDVSITYEIR